MATTRVRPHCGAPRSSGPVDPDRLQGQSSGLADSSGATEASTSASSSSEANLGRTFSVLVVEDDPGVRESTAALLRETGYSVTEAVDGVDGLQRLCDESFDVVILDLRLPRLDGPDMLDLLDDPPPVVVFSAFEYFNENEMRQRFGPKVFAYLQKPVPPGRVLAVVAEAVSGNSAPE